MGAFLDKPKTDKFQEGGEGNGLRFGVASMQGWRVEMEDAHMARTDLVGPLKDWSYFAVFDGHAGATVCILFITRFSNPLFSCYWQVLWYIHV